MLLLMKGHFAIIIQILLGISVLFFGRKLFWLFVGAVGFIAGASLAEMLLRGNPEWLVLVVAAACGVLGALIGVLLQRVAIAVSGFLAGGYVAVVLLHHWGWRADVHLWIPFLIGGIIGALLLSVIFDPAVIVLSSLIGALLTVSPLNMSPLHTGLLFIVLAATGMIAQTIMLKRSGRHSG